MSAKTMPAAERITTARKAIDRKAADASRLNLLGLIRAHLDDLDAIVSDGGETFDAN